VESSNSFRKNKYAFAVGTFGRDMVYSLVSMYLIVFITEVVGVSDRELLTINTIFIFIRFYDAFNDPVMGVIVDNTRSKYGKYKPWIFIGVILASILTVLLFFDTSFSGRTFVIYITFIYLLWGMAWTMNDISYWSMMPSLSYDQKKRDEIGALARIFANLGLFFVVASVIPLTNALGKATGSLRRGYFVPDGYSSVRKRASSHWRSGF
jgi:Na+/melibiose symporter-like transporter